MVMQTFIFLWFRAEKLSGEEDLTTLLAEMYGRLQPDLIANRHEIKSVFNSIINILL